MTTKLILIIPTSIDRTNPCCSLDQCIRHQRFELDTKSTAKGFSGTGLIDVNNNEYRINANLNIAGDQISGNVKTTNRDKNITITNVLQNQLTSYPNMPVLNEWDGIKLSGQSNTANLEFINKLSTKSSGSGNQTGPFNKDITGILEATAIRLPSNTIEDTQLITFSLSGSDQSSWKSTQLQKIYLTIYEGSSVITLGFQLDALTMVLKLGAVRVFGKLSQIVNQIIQKPYDIQFTSSQYNTIFPWSNQWSIIDNLNPSVSLIKPGSILPELPFNLHIIVTLKIIGKRV